MVSLQDKVKEVVRDYLNNGILFTALDVSNAVKKDLPLVRHGEVREEVRELFHSEIEAVGYTRTPIEVTLSDNSVTKAILYHPLSDSWDLDNKYDMQKRNQNSQKAVAISSPSPVVGFVAPTTTVTPTAPAVVAPVTVTPIVPAHPVKELWDQLFQSQPSLFPRR